MKRNWSLEELIETFTLASEDLESISNKSGSTRLGFAVLLKFFQIEARFPNSIIELPQDVINFIAKQLNLRAESFKDYDLESRTCRFHKKKIRTLLSFEETTNEINEQVTTWLYQNTNCYNREQLRQRAYQQFRQLKVEPPSLERLERLVNSAIHSYEKDLHKGISNNLPVETKALIDALLIKQNEVNSETFNNLKSDPGRIGLESVFNEIKKLKTVQELKIPGDIFAQIPHKVLKEYKQRVSSELLSEIRRHPDVVKYSLLSIFFWMRKREITDNLVDLLIAIIHKIDSKAVKKIEKEVLRDVKKVHGKYNILRNMAELSLKNPEGVIRDVIFPSVNQDLLQDLIKDLSMNNSEFRGRVYSVMKNSYSRHYRRMIPELLDVLDFRSNNEMHKPVLDALKFMKKHIHSSVKSFTLDDNIPIAGVVKPKWRNSVIHVAENEETIGKINYEICVLQSLREKLRCKEIWIPDADKYRNPEEDLPKDFDTNRHQYYEALNQPNCPESFIDKIKAEMQEALQKLNQTMPKNTKVKVTKFKGGRVTVSPSEAQDEPMNISALKSDLIKEWPMINLLDILKETDYITGFTDNFKSSGVRENLDRNSIRRRLLLTLFGLGTNTGLKRISKATNSDESFDDLRYIKRKFINKDSLRNAITSVVNEIFNIRMASIWGEGTSCASDSKKFGGVPSWGARQDL